MALNPGDIAFIQYNADGTDNFAFVTLVAIPAGELILFTDNGWLNTNGFRTGEGIITWTAPAGGVPAGTVVTLTTAPSASLGSVTEAGDLNFSADGDQIIAYQVTGDVIRPIAALNNEGAAVFQADATSSNTSALPPGLTLGTSAIALTEIDNAVYTGPRTGNRVTLQTALNNAANWTGSDTINQIFAGSFTIIGGGGGGTLPTVTIAANPSSTTEGSTTAGLFTISRTGDPTTPLTVSFTVAGTATIGNDYLTPASFATNTIEIPAGQSSVSVAITAIDDTLIEAVETVTLNLATATNYTVGTNASATVSINDNDAPAITLISQIQGTGNVFNSAFSGTRTIEGVVVSAFPGSGGFNGFYVQEETADWDNDAATSEGIFVFDPTGLFSGNVGDKVRVTGLVAEFTSSATGITGSSISSSLTQLSLASSVADRNVVALGATALPTVTNVTLPVADASVLERYEGMLVNVSAATGALTVTNNFTLGRFGQVGLSASDRLYQYTQDNAPSVAGYQNYLNNLLDNYIILDDGRNPQNPAEVIHARNGQPLSAINTLRGGDTITSISGVLDQRFEGYRVQTTTPANFVSSNPREATAPEVGGSLKVASFNLLNFFNGDGLGNGFPTARGAENLIEYNRQLDKTVEAILGLNPDVFGYNEMENDGYGPTSAVQALVDALNAKTAPGTYAFVTPPASALNAAGGLGGDQITVGFIYKTSAVRVAPGTNVAALTTGIFAQDDANRAQRPALAATFEQLNHGTPTNATFTAVINHFKSKGSAANLPGDADQGDGQGLSNATRTRAAEELAAWLATNPTNTVDPDYLIMGDLNAYRLEDPITRLINAGYTSLFGTDSYSFQFQGQWGSLDHALANGSLVGQVTGAAKWHINADEPVALDYNLNFKSPAQQVSFYNVDPFRSSDHDPLVVGLNLTPTNAAPTAVSFANTLPLVAENTSTAARIKVADVAIADDGIGTNLLSLMGNDAQFFELEGNALFVRAGTTLDFETKPSYAVTVTVDDESVGATPDASAIFNLAIADVNEAPTAVNFVNAVTTLAENVNTAQRIKVADIAITDDALGTNVLSLGGDHAQNFELEGNALFLKAGTKLDFEVKPSYTVTVKVDDAAIGTTPDASRAFTLNVGNVTETDLRFGQQLGTLKMQAFQDDTLLGQQQGNQNGVAPSVAPFSLFALNSLDAGRNANFVDRTWLDQGEGIGIADGDDGNTARRKRIDGDEILGIQVVGFQTKDALINIDRVASQDGAKIQVKAFSEGVLVDQEVFALDNILFLGSLAHRGLKTLSFDSHTFFDTLHISAADADTQFTFRSVELQNAFAV